MNLEFDPGLIEEVIFRELKIREERGDFTLTEEYHSLTDPIYDNFPLDERSAEFKKIDWNFFKKLGFLDFFKVAFDEFPEFKEKVVGGVVAKAKGTFDEGASLTKGPNEDVTQKRVVLRILSDHFQDLAYLKKLVNHELMHVSDMLCESFAYKDEYLGCNPMEENIIKERYSVFWDIFVDSRLIRKGKDTISDREGRFLEFQSLYKKIPIEVKAAIFDVLWQDEHLTHDRILELAKDVNKVMKIAEGLPVDEQMQNIKKTLLPGAQCPLCQFRTYNWVENIENEAYTIEGIKKDFPDWNPEDGVCDRCVEVYRVRNLAC
ncbi:MAG: hypothetical protein E3K32_04955 [wastewater metagenome]|nr:hypothetical protein [Candidatus Loosdrechtia aerotolerans]